MIKARKFYGIRARDVFFRYRENFRQRFEYLRNTGIASDIRLFGSVARGDDDARSDIDFLVTVQKAHPEIYARVNEILCEWIRFPVHVLLIDDSLSVPERIMKEAINPWSP